MNKILLFFIFCLGTQLTFAQTKDIVIVEVKKSISKSFIVHSISNSIPNSKPFKEKYGIGFVSQGCLTDPFSLKTARENNTEIGELLDKKHGTIWRKELPVTPTGLSIKK